jgi:hypothetical protein
LFQLPDRPSLDSFVFSSRTIYQAFVTVQQEALCGVLERQYGVLLAEAITAVRSRGLYFEHHEREAIALLDTWRRREEICDLGLTLSNRIDQPRDLQEILALCQFDMKLHFFLQDYVMNAPRPEWIEQTHWECTVIPIVLIQTEKHRFIRSFCRLQTLAHIFARCKDWPRLTKILNDWEGKKDASPFHSVEEQAYRLFYGTMPPWESDEMGSVWAYFNTKYDVIYKEVYNGLLDLLRNHPCYVNGDPGQPSDWFEYLPRHVQAPYWGLIENPRHLEDMLNNTSCLAALGPNFAYRILHAEPEIRRNMVLENWQPMEETFIGHPSRMYVREEETVPYLYPADRHAIWDFEQFWSTLASTERPNIAWQKSRLYPLRPGETLEDTVDFAGQREVGWDWGIAIWDDERLRDWKAPVLEGPGLVYSHP